jgi:hypothetical protein
LVGIYLGFVIWNFERYALSALRILLRGRNYGKDQESDYQCVG